MLKVFHSPLGVMSADSAAELIAAIARHPGLSDKKRKQAIRVTSRAWFMPEVCPAAADDGMQNELDHRLAKVRPSLEKITTE